MSAYVLTITCKTTRGIVAAITGYLAEIGARPCGRIDSGIGFGVPGTNPV